MKVPSLELVDQLACGQRTGQGRPSEATACRDTLEQDAALLREVAILWRIRNRKLPGLTHVAPGAAGWKAPDLNALSFAWLLRFAVQPLRLFAEVLEKSHAPALAAVCQEGCELGVQEKQVPQYYYIITISLLYYYHIITILTLYYCYIIAILLLDYYYITTVVKPCLECSSLALEPWSIRVLASWRSCGLKNVMHSASSPSRPALPHCCT